MPTNRMMIRKRPRRPNTTGSLSSARTAPSKLPKDVLGLGQHLVHELKLDDGVDTLGRWMAHHVAGLLVDLKKSGRGPKRKALERQVTSVIFKIWGQQHQQPQRA